MKTAQVSLRACPHCGKKPHPFLGNSTPHHVDCYHCHMEGPHCETQVEAIKAWNRIARLVETGKEKD